VIQKIWTDTRGGVITTELVLVASVTTAMLLAGLSTLRSKVGAEFQNMADTVQTASSASASISEAKKPLDPRESVDGVEIAGEIDTFVAPSTENL
jgi:Flp pilus assembly pilin Flp